jgi:putative PEP-CTERM system TPR-repeat lipoprotein
MQGDEQTLLAQLQLAMDAHPQAAEPKLAMARYYLGKNESDRAISLLSQLEPEQRVAPDALMVAASAHFAQRDFSSARRSLERLVELQPNVARHHFQLALTYAGLGDSAKMKTELERTIALEPGNAHARIVLARLLLNAGEMTELQPHLDILMVELPDNSDVLMLRASAAKAEGNDQAALRLLESAHAIAPSSITAMSLAVQKQRLDDDSGAIKLLESWLKDHPEDEGISFALADVYEKSNQPDRAIKQYEKMLELNEHQELALNNLAWHLRETQSDRALVYARRAVELNPKSANAQDTLAMVLLEKGMYPEAERAIERALKEAPQNPSIRYHSALIARAQGQTKEAITLLTELGQLQQTFPEQAEAAAVLLQLQP